MYRLAKHIALCRPTEHTAMRYENSKAHGTLCTMCLSDKSDKSDKSDESDKSDIPAPAVSTLRNAPCRQCTAKDYLAFFTSVNRAASGRWR